jgi:Ser/Thr protein kinase RdoA (MazF antagonist)
MKIEQILENWEAEKIQKISRENTGIFNESYMLNAGKKILILQKLHVLISKPSPTQNYANVTAHLRKYKYPSQKILMTKNGKLWVKDGAHFWRLMEAVQGEIFTHAPNSKIVEEAGKMLGKTHIVLGKFKGKLGPALPMFQYAKVLQKLRAHKQKLLSSTDANVSETAAYLLENFPRYFLPKNLAMRLIHTDPKISNFVFDSKNRAVAMIDFDTIQKLNPLYDIGDALRSLCGKEEDDAHNSFNAKDAKLFLRGYMKTAKTYLSTQEKSLVHQATALVILGLATRFLNDYIDDSYFGWDSKRYPSRKAHNLARAIGQVALCKDFLKKNL